MPATSTVTFNNYASKFDWQTLWLLQFFRTWAHVRIPLCVLTPLRRPLSMVAEIIASLLLASTSCRVATTCHAPVRRMGSSSGKEDSMLQACSFRNIYKLYFQTRKMATVRLTTKEVQVDDMVYVFDVVQIADAFEACVAITDAAHCEVLHNPVAKRSSREGPESNGERS